jgi:single-strand DNA-binding protein
LNFVQIAGHLGNDPEVRYTSSGIKVTTFRLATKSRKAGKDETIWWRVTLWGEQFDKMVPYLKKGSPLIVFGEMSKPEIFNNREGSPQVSLGITASHLQFSPFGKTEKNDNFKGNEPSQGSSEPQMAHAATNESADAIDDDDIPF